MDTLGGAIWSLSAPGVQVRGRQQVRRNLVSYSYGRLAYDAADSSTSSFSYSYGSNFLWPTAPEEESFATSPPSPSLLLHNPEQPLYAKAALSPERLNPGAKAPTSRLIPEQPLFAEVFLSPEHLMSDTAQRSSSSSPTSLLSPELMHARGSQDRTARHRVTDLSANCLFCSRLGSRVSFLKFFYNEPQD